MDGYTADVIFDEQIQLCADILKSKAREYSTDEDRLHNFKLAAALQECSMRQALAGIMVKHTVSIYDMCRSDETLSLELWTEKITDHLNYLLLLNVIVFLSM